MVDGQGVVFDAAVLSAELALNPGEAVVVDPGDAERSAAGEQLAVEPARVAMNEKALLEVLRRKLDQADAVSHAKSPPEIGIGCHANLIRLSFQPIIPKRLY